MSQQTLETGIGRAVVLHRLALALECLDAVSGRPVTTDLQAAVELPSLGPQPAARPLRRAGPGRFTLLYPQALPTAVVLRVDDPSRGYVPRRIAVDPWPLLLVSEPAPYVPVLSRLVRLRVWPGSAFRPPATTTTVRGRVLRDGLPARWCRVLATGPTAAEAGRAHTDERGEFVLLVHDTGQNPITGTVTLDLSVTAMKVPAPVDPYDRCADLVLEAVARAANPAQPGDLDNPVLRGIATPAGFAADVNPPRSVLIRVGAENNLSGDPLVFVPQP